jgi:primosomal protein N'
MDEEHETSYKADNVPAYHARDIASLRAKQYSIPLILASATPSVESYFKAVKGEYKLLTLSERANKAAMPKTEIVDMRAELANGNRSVLSGRLKEEIAARLKRGEQSILFLNRRGFSTFVSCRNCGYVVKCDHCNVAMTYHKNKNYLTCHYCGYTVNNLDICPECGSKYIKHFGTGTQKVEEEVRELFPEASVIRMDVDTTGTKGSHGEILEKFAHDKIDILIGDYSSVYSDYILLERPVVAFHYDFKEYMSDTREGYFDFKEYMPEVRAYNMDELKAAILDVMDREIPKERKDTLGNMFKYVDSEASNRLSKEVLRLLD